MQFLFFGKGRLGVMGQAPGSATEGLIGMFFCTWGDSIQPKQMIVGLATSE
jgi:hypothetical protein